MSACFFFIDCSAGFGNSRLLPCSCLAYWIGFSSKPLIWSTSAVPFFTSSVDMAVYIQGIRRWYTAGHNSGNEELKLEISNMSAWEDFWRHRMGWGWSQQWRVGRLSWVRAMFAAWWLVLWILTEQCVRMKLCRTDIPYSFICTAGRIVLKSLLQLKLVFILAASLACCSPFNELWSDAFISLLLNQLWRFGWTLNRRRWRPRDPSKLSDPFTDRRGLTGKVKFNRPDCMNSPFCSAAPGPSTSPDAAVCPLSECSWPLRARLELSNASSAWLKNWPTPGLCGLRRTVFHAALQRDDQCVELECQAPSFLGCLWMISAVIQSCITRTTLRVTSIQCVLKMN